MPYTISGAALAPMCAVVATTTAVVDCTCPAGSFVVSGGADAGQNSGRFIRESRAVSTTAWRITCVGGTTDVLCPTYHVLCSRIGP